jgi:hypothetical protein
MLMLGLICRSSNHRALMHPIEPNRIPVKGHVRHRRANLQGSAPRVVKQGELCVSRYDFIERIVLSPLRILSFARCQLQHPFHAL